MKEMLLYILYILVYLRKERRKMSFKAVIINPLELLDMLTIAEKSSDRVWS